MSRRFLTFQLYGPMASWGDIAVGEVRPSFDRPSKSAILGLIAAALGLRREQDEDHRHLAVSFRFAVRLDNPGVYLHDYHTVQVPEGKSARGLPTRRDELAYEKVGTLLSYRDYYSGMFATACLWTPPEVESPYCSLEELADRLKRPRFVLYLGRKACPPALPLDPMLVVAEDVKDALDQAAARSQKRLGALDAKLRLTGGAPRYFWEGNEDEGFEKGPDMELERWDAPVSRSRWQFQPRREYVKVQHSKRDRP